MYQPALAAVHLWIDAATPNNLPGPNADEEASYCRARAAIEGRCAAEATHPAARRAHEQMAALYHLRAGDAQVGAEEIHGWLGEGGNLLPDYA